MGKPGEPLMSGRGWRRSWGVFAGWTVFKDLVCPDNGKTLAQEERVLYLNLEEFSGLSVLMKEYKSDLSDLLYFYNGGSYNSLRLSSVVHTMGSWTIFAGALSGGSGSGGRSNRGAKQK